MVERRLLHRTMERGLGPRTKALAPASGPVALQGWHEMETEMGWSRGGWCRGAMAEVAATVGAGGAEEDAAAAIAAAADPADSLRRREASSVVGPSPAGAAGPPAPGTLLHRPPPVPVAGGSWASAWAGAWAGVVALALAAASASAGTTASGSAARGGTETTASARPPLSSTLTMHVAPMASSSALGPPGTTAEGCSSAAARFDAHRTQLALGGGVFWPPPWPPNAVAWCGRKPQLPGAPTCAAEGAVAAKLAGPGADSSAAEVVMADASLVSVQ